MCGAHTQDTRRLMGSHPCHGADALALALDTNGGALYSGGLEAGEACKKCALQNSKSQWREDRMLLPVLSAATNGFSHPGVFAELGAFNGVLLSNTMLYERCFGWSGVLIEANRRNYNDLIRSGRNSSKFVHSAVCAGSPRTIAMTTSGGRTAAQVDVMSAAFAAKWFRGNQKKSVEQVPCRSLSSILNDAGYPQGTLLSLDVEGAEVEVLSSFDPTAFQVIMVEWSIDNEHNKKVDHLLTKSGMSKHQEWKIRYVSEGSMSRVYVHPSLAAVLARNRNHGNRGVRHRERQEK